MIDPIVMQNKEVIEKVHQYIITNSNLNYNYKNKFVYLSILLILISSYFYKDKIKTVLENNNNNLTELDSILKIKKNINTSNNLEEKKNEYDNIDDDIDEEELSDFEY